MLGLRALPTRKRLLVKSPTLLPKEKPAGKKPRQVFLEPSFWAELSEAADFHSAVFQVMDPKNESVSRNDLVENFLRWALDVYWQNVGGRPGTDSEKQVRAAAYAAALKKLGPPKQQ